jgi:hypothetical protein
MSASVLTNLQHSIDSPRSSCRSAHASDQIRKDRRWGRSSDDGNGRRRKRMAGHGVERGERRDREEHAGKMGSVCDRRRSALAAGEEVEALVRT